MIPEVREKYNATFSDEKYKAFLNDLNTPFPEQIEFRVAETPVFIPRWFTHKMIGACETIVDVILDKDFKQSTERSIPSEDRVPGNDGEHPNFVAFDFGICSGENGIPEPQLVEMQGFPSIFAYQTYLGEAYRRHFSVPDSFSEYFRGFNKESYLSLLKENILAGHTPENVILLELHPHQQKTRIDFYFTAKLIGIPVVGLRELKRSGNDLFYIREGRKIAVERIYNRIIFDEFHHLKNELEGVIDLFKPYQVEWAGHPNWFYRVSKYTLPFIQHSFVPQTTFLNELKTIPDDLENYVLKPLFSFAGQGVVIDVKKEDIENIKAPENWILQKKVHYIDVIKTPDGHAKAEIRVFYFWDKNKKRLVPTSNLSRLSKGKMIGVRYNMNKTWVGGSDCFFEDGGNF